MGTGEKEEGMERRIKVSTYDPLANQVGNVTSFL